MKKIINVYYIRILKDIKIFLDNYIMNLADIIYLNLKSK